MPFRDEKCNLWKWPLRQLPAFDHPGAAKLCSLCFLAESRPRAADPKTWVRRDSEGPGGRPLAPSTRGQGLIPPRGTARSLYNASVSPLNPSRSQRPVPGTSQGRNPRAPSVYCLGVQVCQLAGMTGVGPYWESQNQQLAKTGSEFVPRRPST